ncbi:MAG: T9SS type A sorting domain-containing protein [Draconibacterium sp.]
MTYTASDFLNDTTIRSPVFTRYLTTAEWIKFKVQISDYTGDYEVDSINVRFSSFNYLTAYHIIELNQGDSVLFSQSSIGGGIEPLKFSWHPTLGLSNPDTLITWCKTDSLTQWSNQYDIVATDSCGCISDPNLAYEVRLKTTNLSHLEKVKNNSLNIRQENEKIYFDNPDFFSARINLYSLTGAIISSFETKENHININSYLQTTGTYIMSVTLGGKNENIKVLKK